MKTRDGIVLVLWALCLAQVIGGGDLLPSILPIKPAATAATYVFEKDDTAIPSAVQGAFDKLNRQGIVATFFEDDTRDGDGEIPDQYKGAHLAATAAGLPAMVVTARGGDEVLRTVKAPTTETEVLEAVK